jgi:hypothetical protein
LQALSIQKDTDIRRSAPIVRDAAQVEKSIVADLSAGLITKADAALQRAQLDSVSTGFTDDRVFSVRLKDDIQQKLTIAGPLVEVLTQKAQVDTQLATFAVGVVTGTEQIHTDTIQIARLRAAIKTAESTPYYRASISPNVLAFAFVPYDNEANIHIGAPLYDCHAQLVACYQVGTILRVFSDEEHAIHPVFKTEVRGFLIQLSLNRKQAAKSRVLFTRKPFLF